MLIPRCDGNFFFFNFQGLSSSREQKWIVLPGEKKRRLKVARRERQQENARNVKIIGYYLHSDALLSIFSGCLSLYSMCLLERYLVTQGEMRCVRMRWMSGLGWGKQQHLKNGCCLQKCHRCQGWCWGDLAVKEWPFISAHRECEDVIFSLRADVVYEQCPVRITNCTKAKQNILLLLCRSSRTQKLCVNPKKKYIYYNGIFFHYKGFPFLDLYKGPGCSISAQYEAPIPMWSQLDEQLRGGMDGRLERYKSTIWILYEQVRGKSASKKIF